MKEKYDAWAKVLIEPSSFNDARLFSLETRFDKEEEIRYQTMQEFKDLLRKFIFTFEQDAKLNQNFIKEDASNLPNLLNTNSSFLINPLPKLNQTQNSFNFVGT